MVTSGTMILEDGRLVESYWGMLSTLSDTVKFTASVLEKKDWRGVC